MADRVSDRLKVIAITFNMTDHCNLSCANCNHASPLLDAKFADLDGFNADLAALGQVLRAGEIKLVGGEPTLHPQVVDFIKAARASGVAKKIHVTSNAVLLHKMTDEFWDNIDILELSIYPGVKYRGGGEDGLDMFREKAAARNIELVFPGRPVFKKTLLNNKIEDPVLVDAIYKNCGQVYKWGCHSVHEGRYYFCGPAPYLEQRMAKRGEHVENKIADSVQIQNNPNLRRDLEAYLNRQEPLIACAYCLGDNGIDFAHHQLNKKGVIDENLADDGDILQQVYFPPMVQVQMAARRKLLAILGQ